MRINGKSEQRTEKQSGRIMDQRTKKSMPHPDLRPSRKMSVHSQGWRPFPPAYLWQSDQQVTVYSICAI